MSSDLAPLLGPLKLGPSLLKNRIVMGALTRHRAVPTNVPNGIMLKYYVQRAKGGAGLIVNKAALITQQG
ncbi:FMN-linked oxidoreductase [Athelia psychrophila]|uniref:FMN-linked oxidoreductase n=1 Tax=Athelia psychrophila TaxID=1759441 RepID=A0A167VK04_9AGAM|nr:FMN-linked oxidoreductase [Fibularhizoctonia sp. CBS 109695]